MIVKANIELLLQKRGHTNAHEGAKRIRVTEFESGDKYVNLNDSALEKYYPWARHVVHMSPDQFLRVAAPLRNPQKWKIANIKRVLQSGEQVGAPYLAVNLDTKRVLGHEGRHRMLVFKEMGITSVPVVLIYYRKDPKTNVFDEVDQGQDTNTVVSPNQLRPE